MNVSYEWLRAFVPFDESATQLRDLITAHIATVDELVALRADLAAIVVARVVEEAPHPDSDHLHVTKVDAGTGTLLDVVCGAPNVTAGKLYPFAKTGVDAARRPQDPEAKDSRRRSPTACSARRASSRSAQEQDGIMELDLDVPPGTPFLQRAATRRHAASSSTSARIGRICSRTSASRARSPRSRSKPFALPRDRRASARRFRAATTGARLGARGDRRRAHRRAGSRAPLHGRRHSRREGRTESRLARPPPRVGRIALDQQRRRREQLRAPRARTADARVRSREARRHRRSSFAARAPARRSRRSTAPSARCATR